MLSETLLYMVNS